ncbi:hypothetical protein LINGRAHAP2_LOCUS23810, partial [Linum grandiflorum]
IIKHKKLSNTSSHHHTWFLIDSQVTKEVKIPRSKGAIKIDEGRFHEERRFIIGNKTSRRFQQYQMKLNRSSVKGDIDKRRFGNMLKTSTTRHVWHTWRVQMAPMAQPNSTICTYNR